MWCYVLPASTAGQVHNTLGGLCGVMYYLPQPRGKYITHQGGCVVLCTACLSHGTSTKHTRGAVRCYVLPASAMAQVHNSPGRGGCVVSCTSYRGRGMSALPTYHPHKALVVARENTHATTSILLLLLLPYAQAFVSLLPTLAVSACSL